MLSSKHSLKERENSRFKLDTIFLLLEDPVILANTLLNNIVKIAIPAFHIPMSAPALGNGKKEKPESSRYKLFLLGSRAERELVVEL